MLWTLAGELLLYGVVVAAYLYGTWRYFQHWLGFLYTSNPRVYALVSLGLIVFQGLLLEVVTSRMVTRCRRLFSERWG